MPSLRVLALVLLGAVPGEYAVGCDCGKAMRLSPDAGVDSGADSGEPERDGGARDAGQPDAGTCDGGPCPSCQDQCLATCQTNCWAAFTTCLDGCTTSFCAPFCQADLGTCYDRCATSMQVAICRAACP